jgi:hypothetical protein
MVQVMLGLRIYSRLSFAGLSCECLFKIYYHFIDVFNTIHSTEISMYYDR